MLLIIDQKPQSFTPLEAFRHEFNLPEDFGVNLFMLEGKAEPRSTSGAGASLRMLRELVLQAVPFDLPLNGWNSATIYLQMVFRRGLIAISDELNLKSSEVDCAVKIFGDVCQAYVHELVNAQAAGESAPSFAKVYLHWLTTTVIVSPAVYTYDHQGETWHIRAVRTAYGWVGLIIQMSDDVVHVQDTENASPLEHFMGNLLSDVAVRLSSLVRHTSGTSRTAARGSTSAAR